MSTLSPFFFRAEFGDCRRFRRQIVAEIGDYIVATVESTVATVWTDFKRPQSRQRELVVDKFICHVSVSLSFYRLQSSLVLSPLVLCVASARYQCYVTLRHVLLM